MNNTNTTCVLQLSEREKEIVYHRLSAATLGEVARDTFELTDEQGDRLGEISDALCNRLEKKLEVRTPLEAWCIAECVEGSTWDGQGGYDRAMCRKFASQVEKFRIRLNGNPDFVRLLGREVEPTADLFEETAIVENAMRAL